VSASSTFISFQQTWSIMTIGRSGCRALSLRHSARFSSCTGNAAISAVRPASSRMMSMSF